MTATEKNQEQLAEGTLLSHLIELRSRLLKMVASVLIMFVVLLPFSRQIFTLVSEPIRAALPGNDMIATGVVSPVVVPFKTTLYAALFLVMPVVLYQIWAFVAPGLYRREKRFAIPLLMTSILLFYAGIAFAYLLVFPLIFEFITTFATEGVDVQTDITLFLDFVIAIVFAFGLAFEVPIATVLVCWTGLVSVQSLSKARPYVFLGAFIVGMFLTPPDMISQTLLAIPVYLLYELGILMSKIFTSSREEKEEEATVTE
ncbi:MAG: twin-arginine translocase subunit TatC [Pseudomonadota bacterium]